MATVLESCRALERKLDVPEAFRAVGLALVADLILGCLTLLSTNRLQIGSILFCESGFWSP